MSVTSQDRDISSVGYARHIGSAVLYIEPDGDWLVGQFGQKVSEYHKVKYSNITSINDDTFEFTALSVEAKNGGYKLYLQSNADANVFVEVDVDAAGNVANVDALTQAELYAAEVSSGADLNGNGGLGDSDILVCSASKDGTFSAYLDKAGVCQIKAANGNFIPLSFAGAPVTLALLDGRFEIEAVLADAQKGGYRLFLRDNDDNVLEIDVSNAGVVDPAAIDLLSADEVSRLEAETGTDLNNKSDTPVTSGWTTTLNSAEIRSAVERFTQSNSKIDHAELVNIVDVAIQSLTGATKVGSGVFSDLKAIASRGQSLFTAKDLNGTETGYLTYVFDKLVNGSKANTFYHGGSTTAQNLGNLNPDSTVDTLQKLSNKWLLGKDLPNPTTQGDTANPNARAATGSYKAFNFELMSGSFSAFDVNQGSAGTCYLLAAMALICQDNPNAFKSIFVSNGVGTNTLSTWGVRFLDNSRESHWVTVNNELVVLSQGDADAAYTKAKGVDAQGNQTRELWAPVLEKAYAQANEIDIFHRAKSANSMVAIEGGLAEPIVYLIGGKVTAFTAEVVTYNGVPALTTSLVPNGSTALAELTKSINAGKSLWLASNNDTKSGESTLFTKQHAFFVYDADPTRNDNTTVKVYNPWGFKQATAGDPSPNHLAPFDADLVNLVGVDGYDFWSIV